MYKEYDPTINSQPDSSVNKWHAIGISPIAAASACYLGKVPSNRSEVEAITHCTSSSWNWSRTRKSSTPEPKDSWTSAPPTWRPLSNWHLGTITRFSGSARRSASTDWEICGSASRTSMCLTRFESMERSRYQCYVITFENSSFDLMEVTYEVWTNLSQERTHGWVQQGRRTEFSIRLTLMRSSLSRSGRSIESSTTSTWARPGSRLQPRTLSMRCSMSGNVKSSILGMHGDATTKRSTMRGRWQILWRWKRRSMTSSSRTPSWAANELPQWITSPASWLYRHQSSGPRLSWIGCGISLSLQGRGCRRVYRGSCKTSCLLLRGCRRVYRGSCKT